MRKSILEGNILPKAKQRLIFQGISTGEIIHITRDVVEMSIGVIELPDQSRVPGGRKRAGEFTVTLQMARNTDREAYLDWFNKCVDRNTRNQRGRLNVDIGNLTGGAGIDPTYKRNGTIIYYRLFQGDPGLNSVSGSRADPVKAQLFGCFPSSIKLPDYDINSDEGDGDCMLEVTINFDDVELDSPGIFG